MADYMMSGIPVVDPGPGGGVNLADLFRDTRRLTLRSIDGNELFPFTGHEFISRKGATGLGAPPIEVEESRLVGMDGSLISNIDTPSRKIFLPIWLGSDSGHDDYMNRREPIRRLLSHRLRDYRRLGGTFDLVATSRRSGERKIRCQYLSGREGDTGATVGGTYWESVGLELLCVQPYWVGDPWMTPTIRRPLPVGWMSGSNYTVPWPGRLSSSRALGENIPVVIGGEVPTWPVVEVVGPGSSVTVSGEGTYIHVPGGVAEGEQMVITTDPRHRDATFNGVRDWSRVGPLTRWSPIDPGDQKINVVIPDADDVTSAVVRGDSLYEEWC